MIAENSRFAGVSVFGGVEDVHHFARGRVVKADALVGGGTAPATILVMPHRHAQAASDLVLWQEGHRLVRAGRMRPKRLHGSTVGPVHSARVIVAVFPSKRQWDEHVLSGIGVTPLVP